MKKVISRLVLFFVIIVILLAALGVLGFAVIANVPAAEGHLGNLRLPLQVLCLVIPLAGIFLAFLAVKSVSGGIPLPEQSDAKKISLYEQILDAIPFPITVTDINMNWLFVNKPVCDMLNKKRDEFYGKHCSSWGAAICNTENCGIANLRKGKPSTTFTQFGNDYHVDVFYIRDSKGNKAGHIELVRDITTETNLKKQQSEIVNYLVSLSKSFSEASNQVTSESHALAQGATEQASYIASLSESVSEVNRMVKDNAQATTTAFNEVQQECQLMAACREQMHHMLDAMRTINEKSHNISKTTKVIDNIAFQTNILALNAAVEAARVGQHGKGFAVVAEEVRNLASRSAEAARETSALIESSFQSVTNGNKIVEKVNGSLNALMEGSQKNAEQIAAVQAVSIRQSEAMEQISASIGRISAILQQNNATAEELASTSADMNRDTDKLHTTILTLSSE